MPKPIPKPEDFYKDYGDGPAPTIANIDAVVIIDNGEPLVDVCDLSFPVFKGSKILVRQGVAERLYRVSENLKAQGGRLVVLSGWQPKTYGNSLHRLSKSALRIINPTWPPDSIREAAHQVFSTNDTFAPPAFTTGGAVLINNMGERMVKLSSILNLIPGLGVPEERSFTSAFPEAKAMEAAGFIRDPWEPSWWCYGTSAWSLAKDEPCAIYGRVEKSTK